MKFLEYEYLKAKESWERIKITTAKVWDSALNDEPKSPGIEKLSNFLTFLNNTKEQIKHNLNILKSPFSLIFKGIKNNFVNTKIKNDYDLKDERDFCEKFNDAELKLRDLITDLEIKLNKKLEEKIEKENEILEGGKQNPDSLSYFDKQTISKDILYIKETIYNIYNYFKTAALNQLKRLVLIKKK